MDYNTTKPVLFVFHDLYDAKIAAKYLLDNNIACLDNVIVLSLVNTYSVELHSTAIGFEMQQHYSLNTFGFEPEENSAHQSVVNLMPIESDIKDQTKHYYVSPRKTPFQLYSSSFTKLKIDYEYIKSVFKIVNINVTNKTHAIVNGVCVVGLSQEQLIQIKLMF